MKDNTKVWVEDGIVKVSVKKGDKIVVEVIHHLDGMIEFGV